MIDNRNSPLNFRIEAWP